MVNFKVVMWIFLLNLFLPIYLLATEIIKEHQFFFFLLCLKVSLSVVFLCKKPRNWFLCFFCSEFPPCGLGISVGHTLQLTKILSLFIIRKVPCPPLSSVILLRQRSPCLSLYLLPCGWHRSFIHFNPSQSLRLSQIDLTIDLSMVRKFWFSP